MGNVQTFDQALEVLTIEMVRKVALQVGDDSGIGDKEMKQVIDLFPKEGADEYIPLLEVSSKLKSFESSSDHICTYLARATATVLKEIANEFDWLRRQQSMVANSKDAYRLMKMRLPSAISVKGLIGFRMLLLSQIQGFTSLRRASREIQLLSVYQRAESLRKVWYDPKPLSALPEILRGKLQSPEQVDQVKLQLALANNSDGAFEIPVIKNTWSSHAEIEAVRQSNTVCIVQASDQLKTSRDGSGAPIVIVRSSEGIDDEIRCYGKMSPQESVEVGKSLASFREKFLLCIALDDGGRGKLVYCGLFEHVIR